MTAKRMLIDASHPEETRVVVINGKKLEDFDVEVGSKKQLKGNIYLAKVTRVEPSLQAAFVNYGGNRHGFLAFNEIHPDYYQIPIADKEALLANEQLNVPSANEDEQSNDEGTLETLGGDISEELRLPQPRPQHKNYKIQEVIKRNQVLLIQVVKEERGTKGAALSTYLSLAGRYCVLMPNTARGGGISRKINNLTDRKRLKAIVGDLGIPSSMAVIIRTAGSKRSKVEIKRDYEYTTRLWSNVRELTLESIAPALVHEEGNLIKRAIRDLYNKELEEVIVSGDNGYRMAKDFMKLLIPSHSKKVQPYSDTNIPLMQRYQIEGQLDAIHSPEVYLKSGGYIVINPTEALVSIDVNSGRATKERNIEETALKTNLEAANEIACQLKLRDLSGLIVIDFIDMESTRNQQKVERQIKDAMRIDRARIQIGKISPFGLLEMSRQRLRPSLIETSSEPCPHCNGSGTIRSIDSTAVHILRVIEEECLQAPKESHTIYVPTSVALYLFNQKRIVLAEIEERYKTSIYIKNDDTLIPPGHRIDGKVDIENSHPIGRETDQSQPKELNKKRRRRRNRRNISSDNEREVPIHSDPKVTEQGNVETQNSDQNIINLEIESDDTPKRRRRGRRGGRRKIKKLEETQFSSSPETENLSDTSEDLAKNQTRTIPVTEESNAPPHKKRTRKKTNQDTGTKRKNKEEGQPKLDEDSVDKKTPTNVSKAKASKTPILEEPPVISNGSKKRRRRKADPSDKNEAESLIANVQMSNPIKQDPKGKEVATGNQVTKEPIKRSTRKTTKQPDKTTVINIETSDEGTSPIRNGWWRR